MKLLCLSLLLLTFGLAGGRAALAEEQEIACAEYARITGDAVPCDRLPVLKISAGQYQALQITDCQQKVRAGYPAGQCPTQPALWESADSSECEQALFACQRQYAPPPQDPLPEKKLW